MELVQDVIHGMHCVLNTVQATVNQGTSKQRKLHMRGEATSVVTGLNDFADFCNFQAVILHDCG